MEPLDILTDRYKQRGASTGNLTTPRRWDPLNNRRRETVGVLIDNLLVPGWRGSSASTDAIAGTPVGTGAHFHRRGAAEEPLAVAGAGAPAPAAASARTSLTLSLIHI